MIHASNFSRPFLIFLVSRRWMLHSYYYPLGEETKGVGRDITDRTQIETREILEQISRQFCHSRFSLFLLACLPSLIGWLGKVVLGRTERVPSRFEMDVSIVQYGWSMSFLSPSSFHPFSSCTSCKAKAGKNKIKIKIMVHRIFPFPFPFPVIGTRIPDIHLPSRFPYDDAPYIPFLHCTLLICFNVLGPGISYVTLNIWSHSA